MERLLIYPIFVEKDAINLTKPVSVLMNSCAVGPQNVLNVVKNEGGDINLPLMTKLSENRTELIKTPQIFPIFITVSMKANLWRKKITEA